MQKQTLLALFLLSTLIVSCFAADAKASSISIEAHGERISVNLSLHFFQNATAMPSVNGTFTETTSTDLRLALEESLKTLTSNISISAVTGEVRSTKDWINSTIHFEVSGISTRKGDLVVLNCSWISLNVSRDLRLGNLSYNLIGAKYIRPAFEKYVDFDKPPLNETIETVAFQSSDSELTPTAAVQQAGNATLLDFRNLAVPIQYWKRTYNLTKESTTFAFRPSSAVNLTMRVNPREGSAHLSHAAYSYDATVSISGLAHAEGNAMIVDAYGAYKPMLMFGVILVTLIAAVAAVWTYRSRRRQMLRRRR